VHLVGVVCIGGNASSFDDIPKSGFGVTSAQRRNGAGRRNEPSGEATERWRKEKESEWAMSDQHHSRAAKNNELALSLAYWQHLCKALGRHANHWQAVMRCLL
jgi:hypothetical protein